MTTSEPGPTLVYMAINVLGPLTVEPLSGTRLAPRERVVLGVLFVRRGEEVSTEALADALWQGSPPASAAKVIQGCVVRLRRALGAEAITTGTGGYRLEVPAHDIDACRFEDLLRRSGDLLSLDEPDRAAYALEEALTLWRGRPLPELEDWEPGRIEADRLTDLRLRAEEVLLEARIATGRHHDAVAVARARVTEQPLREHRWELLARAQYQAGEQGDALETLRTARRVLLDELGLDPGPGLVHLEQAILRQDEHLEVSPAPQTSTRSPYPGLAAYDRQDADTFFGRDEETEACLDLLATHGVLAVVGPSGSGKSSLVRAGVAARLQQRGRTVLVMTPGRHPLDTLKAALRDSSHAHRSVVIVDQAEELVTQCQDETERQAFIAALTDLVPEHALVLALSADRLAEVAAYPRLLRLVEPGLYLLTRPEPDQLRQIIERPARLAGLLLEPGLVDLLVRDVEEQPGALPLLSHALALTWARREGRTLTVSGYQATGGIRGAVAQTAEDVYGGCTQDERAALRELLLRLVTPSPDREPVLNRVAREVVAPDPDRARLVDRLVEARLLTRDQGAVEIAHASLVQAWPRLRGWLGDDLQGQLLWHHLTDTALAWEASGRPPDELYRGTRLAATTEWARRAHPSLTQVESDFLEASQRAHESRERSASEQAARARRSVRRLRVLVAAVAVAALVATFFGTMATRQAQRADAESLRARSHELAASSLQALESDAGLGRTLAVAAADVRPEAATVQTFAALHQALAGDHVVARLTMPHMIGRLTADLHPDGDRLAMASEFPDGGSRAVEVQDLSGRPLSTLTLPSTGAAASAIFVGAAYTPDGKELAAGVVWNPEHWARIGPEPSALPPQGLVGVNIYDAETHELTQQLDVGGCGGGLLGVTATHVVAYSTASRRCEWPMAEGRDLVLVDRRSLERTVLSEGITNLLGSARLSADGRYVVHEDRPGGTREVVVRDLSSGQEVARWPGDTLREISPDGEWVLQALDGWTVHEVATGQEVSFGDPRGFGVYADFAPDGETLTTVTDDGSVSWWDFRSGEQRGFHRGLRAGAVSVAANGLVSVADAGGVEVAVLDPDRGESGPRGRTCEVAGSASTELVVREGELRSTIRCPGAPTHSDYRTDPTTGTTTKAADDRVVWSETGVTWRERSVPPPEGAPPEAVSQLLIEVHDPDRASGPVELQGMCPLLFAETEDLRDGCADFPEQPFFMDVCGVTFSPDGSLVAATSCPGSPGLAVWDTGSGELLHAASVTDPETAGPPTHARFTPDGRELVVSTESSRLVVLAVDGWEVVRRSSAPVPDGWYMPVIGFLPTGDLVAVTQVNPPGGITASLHVLDRETLVPVRTRLTLHEGTVLDAELSPDRRRAATAGSQGLVRVWDTDTLDLVHEVPVGQAVHAVAWLDDGRLALLAEEGTVDIVLLDHETLTATARAGLTRPLTTAECLRFDFGTSCPSLGQLRDGASATPLDGSYVLSRRADDVRADLQAGYEAALGEPVDAVSADSLAGISVDMLGEGSGLRLRLEDGTFRVDRDGEGTAEVEGAEPHCAGTATVEGDRLRLDAERGTWCYVGMYLEARFTQEGENLRLHSDGFRGPVYERYLWGDQLLLGEG